MKYSISPYRMLIPKHLLVSCRLLGMRSTPLYEVAKVRRALFRRLQQVVRLGATNGTGQLLKARFCRPCPYRARCYNGNIMSEERAEAFRAIDRERKSR